MKKKILWAVVIVVVLAGGYAVYLLGKNQGASSGVLQAMDSVAQHFNQSEARVGQCTQGKSANSVIDDCSGGKTSAGGHTFCWGRGGLSISCYY